MVEDANKAKGTSINTIQLSLSPDMNKASGVRDSERHRSGALKNVTN